MIYAFKPSNKAMAEFRSIDGSNIQRKKHLKGMIHGKGVALGFVKRTQSTDGLS